MLINYRLSNENMIENWFDHSQLRLILVTQKIYTLTLTGIDCKHK